MSRDEFAHRLPAGRQTATTAQPVGTNAPTGAATRRYDSRDLFGADAEIEIVHQHGLYRLKITKQGKLILNK